MPSDPSTYPEIFVIPDDKQKVAELRALLKLALVLMGAEEDPPAVADEWVTWVHMTKLKLKELGLE